MSVTSRRGAWLLTGTLWALASGIPAFADDTELFVSNSSQFSTTARPNVLFIIDTSLSMLTEVETQATYDPEYLYDGDCSAARVYWRTGPGDPPPCTVPYWFNDAALMCDVAIQAFATSAGRYTDGMAQYDPGNQDRWEWLHQSQKDRLVECEDDSGLHGDVSGVLYAQNGDDTQLWSAAEVDEVAWGQSPTNRAYTIYDGNYLNWYYGPVTTSTRLQLIKDAATNLLNTVNGVNVGLMRFNTSEGGSVIYAMEDIATGRAGMTTAINDLSTSFFTPLSETLYEAQQYLAGRKVDYGDPGGWSYGPIRSVPESRAPPGSSVYKSPIEYGCQKNYIVLLTDGEPTYDTSAENKIEALPGFSELVGNDCDGSGSGSCLDDLAEYMFEADLDGDATNGTQNVITHTIGFAVDFPLLSSTASRGGGEYHTADDTASLSTALANIVTKILNSSTTFTAPTVAVNSFNRIQNINDMFISVFDSAGDVHWPGNLKKYRLRAADGEVVDANDNLAVDPDTGYFIDTAQSYWSADVDGADTTAGGAANLIPDPAARDVYTYLGDPILSAASNRIASTNLLIDDALLGIGQVGDPTRNDLINFILGLDVTDIDDDTIVDEPRYQMGDPLHAKPISVIYGGTVGSPDIDDAVIYFATNDGYLHAIDPATGVEMWSFIPPELMGDQVELLTNAASARKHYGIDGNMTVQQLLKNNNGIVEPAEGEKVYLYFGLRRGGMLYYGLDVTDPDDPQLMWTLDSASLPGVGQTWSTPMPSRIDIRGPVQNAEKMVLVFGGGYDPTQDNNGGSTDIQGNAIYVVDSVSGALLWHASDSGADRNLAKMQYSIPSDVRVIDLNADDFADRIYMADMGGQVWRFDIFNGEPASDLITGGVIAQLGGAPQDPPPVADTRRFYYAPDVALVNDDNNNFVHVGIGSGHRAHPNSEFTRDRFYALRDYTVFGTRTQAEYDGATPLTDADLVDVADNVNAVVPIGSPGWRFELRDGGWLGEKVLAEARTFDNQVFFTTFSPEAGASVDDCQPVLGTNRLYVMDIFNGAPVNNLDEVGGEEILTETDRYVEFMGTIASEVVFLFPSPDDPDTCVGDECTPPPMACVGLFCFPPGFANDPVMTFWSQEGAQ
ncbi:MAG: PilC/PilY family type IV pilus protein [Gammaproteobacteria bacterium]